MKAVFSLALLTGCTSLLGISDPTPANPGDGGPDVLVDSNIDAPPPCTASIAFKAETTLDIGKQGFDLVVGAFNTDAGGSKPDVAIAAGDEVLIFHGDGTGVFGGDMQRVQVPTAANRIALDDFDTLGLDDLALWTDGGTAVIIRVQNRANNPPFNAEQPLTGPFTSVKNVVPEQLDGNLRTDLFVYDSAAGSRVYTQNAASGSFSRDNNLIGTGSDELLLTRQLDASQRADAVFLNGTNVKLSLQLNSGGFQALNTIATGAASRGIAVGNFDGDTLPDVVVSTSQGLVLFRNTPASPGTFMMSGVVSPLMSATPMKVADLNNDGRDDIVIANAVILQCAPATSGGPGVFTQVEALTAAPPVTFGDVTGDGKLDLLRLEGNALKVRVQ